MGKGGHKDDNYHVFEDESGEEELDLNQGPTGEKWNNDKNDDIENNTTVNTNNDTDLVQIFCLMMIMMCLAGIGFSAALFPQNFTEKLSLLPGESYVVNAQVNPFWYKHAKIHTPNENEPPMGVFYYSKCPYERITRQTSFLAPLDDYGRHREIFHLPWFSSFNVTWNSSPPTTLSMYRTARDGGERYFVRKIESNDTVYVGTGTKFLILEWRPSVKNSRFQGSALINFNISAYNQSQATSVCNLSNNSKCTVVTKDTKSCSVVDIIDFSPFSSTTLSPSSPNSTLTSIKFTRKGSKYFLIVLFPFLMTFLFFCLVLLISIFWGRNDSDAPVPVQTELSEIENNFECLTDELE